MNVVICVSDISTYPDIRRHMATEFPGTELQFIPVEKLPKCAKKIDFVFADEAAFLYLWRQTNDYYDYMILGARAYPIFIEGTPKVFFRMQTSYSISNGMAHNLVETTLIPLFTSLDEITEDGSANDWLTYHDIMGPNIMFAVRHNGDTLIADYADKVKSGSRVIVSIAGKRYYGRIHISKNGVSFGGNRYTMQECEDLPIFIIARIRRVLRGRS